jgi:pyruvate/2-oxoglutarate dehydrogenase complex dihydrolipoamide dehydrogenase (E3) component
MTQPEEFDLVILGGGTGSTVAAWTFAGEGNRVAVVDRKYIGGSCPNVACLPSQNIIHNAKVASYFRRSKEFGITHDGFTVHMPGVRDRKRKMVSGLNDMYMENYRKTGAEFILGTGRFIAPRTGFGASSVALADVNGDGKPDLLEANESSNSVGAFWGMALERAQHVGQEHIVRCDPGGALSASRECLVRLEHS